MKLREKNSNNMKIINIILFLSLTVCIHAEKYSAEVKNFNGKPTLVINGKPEYPMIYALTDLPGGRLTWEEMPQHNIKRMYDAGVRIFYFCLFFDEMWKSENDSLNIIVAQKQLRGITEVCPDARVIIRLHVHPPVWWYSKYPKECVEYADTKALDIDLNGRFKRIQHNDPATVIRYSFASKVWQKTMNLKVAEFCRKLEATVEGNSVIGIQVASGIYGEGHYWGFMKNMPDVSLPMQIHFREWLNEKYHTVANLQKAWGSKTITFDNASVPDLNERKNAESGLFVSLPAQQNLVDYYKCQHELIPEIIISFAKTIKENWSRPILTGAFNGYTFPVFMRETAGGHLEFEKLLKSPYIDYLCGPQCYWPDAAKPSDPARSRGLVTSCRLNGKLWLDEYDTQPDLTKITTLNSDKNTPGYDSIINSAIAVVRRNMSVSAIQGQGFWFFDFGVGGGREFKEAKDNGSNGWWDYPEILAAISNTKAVFEKQTIKQFTSNADVLMVYDTEIYYNLTTNIELLAPVFVNTYWMSAAAWKAGIAADYIHIDDLNKVNMAQYKVVVFNNTFRITPEQLKLIKEKVLNNNRNVIWMYAPGYFDGKTYSTKTMRTLTGIDFTVLKPEKPYEISIDQPDLKYKYGVSNKPLNPLFVVDDVNAETIGVYTELNKTAIAKKKLKGFTSWYVGLPEYGDILMKYLFQKTGVHFYGEQGEIFYEGNNMLIMHSIKEGKHKIHLQSGKTVDCEIPKGGATLIFDSETGKKL